MTNAAFYTTHDGELGYRQLFQILVRRIYWLGGAIACTTVLAAAITLFRDSTYESSIQLLVEPNYRQNLALDPEQPQPTFDTEDFATQLNLMRSRQFVEQAIKRVEDDYPEICASRETLNQCTDRIQSALRLSQVEEGDTQTRIFEAVFTSDDPETAQAFLEALQQIYLTYNLEYQEQRLTRGLGLINQQLEDVQNNLALSQRSLERFRQRENLINPEQQAIAISEALSTTEQAQREAQVEYRDALARYNSLQQQLSLNPRQAIISARLSQSTRFQNVLNELQAAELALEQRRAIYTDSDPGVQDLISRRQRTFSLLQEEVRRVLQNLPSSQGLNEDDLLAEGQLGEIELSLVENLMDAQVSLRGLQARQAQLVQEEQQLRSELNRFPSLIAAYDRLQPEVTTQRTSLEQLLQLRQELSNELAQGGFNWEVVEEPRWGEERAPDLRTNLLLGLVSGLFLGSVLAFAREAMDDVIHNPDAMQRRSALPLLGIVPTVGLSSSAGLWRYLPWRRSPSLHGSILPVVHEQSFREAVDLIYKTIQLSSPAARPRSVMVTSAIRGEGKTTLALGLALSAARSHQRVLLVDADLRHPTLHHQLSLANGHGLSTVLSVPEMVPIPAQLSLADASIDVLTAGTSTAEPVRLLSSQRMRDILASFEAAYDLVVIDSSVVLGIVDALQIASLCQGVILVNRMDQITQQEMEQAIAMLSKVPLLGLVANDYQGPLSRPIPSFENNGRSPAHPYELLEQK